MVSRVGHAVISATDLYSKIKDLPDKEQRIVTMIVERIHEGLKIHGPWDGREHKLEQDILEEQADTAVYNMAAMIDLLERKETNDQATHNGQRGRNNFQGARRRPVPS